ncbi:hypothetical protein BC332_07735 [Capsicum chinense]|nr:hypothetical protein BC332_07735 [Capsicum chinense]
MSHGENFSLEVPVLASIYGDLWEISSSSNLGSYDALFPIHYFYGWIGEYFETYYHVNVRNEGAASSSIKSNDSQEPHWKRLKKKHKDFSDQHHEFVDFDSISIDTAILEDGVAGSTMHSADLAYQISNLSLDNAMNQAINKDPSAKLPKNVKSCQNVPTTYMVAEANDERPSNVPKVNIVNLSSLEALLADFLKKYGYYDVAKFSSSQKISRDAHQELIHVVQQHIHPTNKDKVKMDNHLAELQKVLERAEKKLVAWTSKKKKIVLLIEEHQKKLSKNQESVTNIKEEIHALDKIIPLS